MVMHKGIKYYPSIQELSPSKSHLGALGYKDLGIVNPGGHFYPKRVKGYFQTWIRGCILIENRISFGGRQEWRGGWGEHFNAHFL